MNEHSTLQSYMVLYWRCAFGNLLFMMNEVLDCFSQGFLNKKPLYIEHNDVALTKGCDLLDNIIEFETLKGTLEKNILEY